VPNDPLPNRPSTSKSTAFDDDDAEEEEDDDDGAMNEWRCLMK
jgi:hypothetical protein